MAYVVDVPDVEILPDLQEDEAARMLLLLAHDEGTIDDEELLLLNFALDEDLKKTSSKAAIQPGEKFDLDTESEGSCISMFRFTKEEIRRLCVLLQFPGPTMSKYHVSWTTEEGLCIVLRRLAYPCRLDDLVPIFGRWKQDLSIIINSVCTHICSTWSRLLTDFSHALGTLRSDFKPTQTLFPGDALFLTAGDSLMVRLAQSAGLQLLRSFFTMATSDIMALIIRPSQPQMA